MGTPPHAYTSRRSLAADALATLAIVFGGAVLIALASTL